MKKIIISLCLLYAADSCAMAGAKIIVGLAISPFIVPATCYAIKTMVDQEKVIDDFHNGKEIQTMSSEEKRIEAHCLRSNADSLSVFIDGAYQGIAPGINVAKLTGTASVSCPSVHDMKSAEQVGFFAGLSLYTTLPLAKIALDLLKKAR